VSSTFPNKNVGSQSFKDRLEKYWSRITEESNAALKYIFVPKKQYKKIKSLLIFAWLKNI
jgi:hypothetical protein